VLPALTLAIPLTGRYIRLIRAAVLEELSSDYVKGACSRGIPKCRIIFGEVLPNAMKGIITLLGMSVAALLGYTVIVESIFSWPGLGTLVIESINYRDYPVIQAFVLFMTVVYVGMSFLVDLLVGLMDPRVKVGGDVNET
jgi:peptide/nickel transport system permease protein